MMLTVCRLGPTSYRQGLALQDGLVQARAEGRTGDWLLYPEHPPVLTMGRGAQRDNLIADPATLESLGIEVFEVARGGDVTWHGPGQLVGYVVCDLTRRGRDLHRFLRDLEEALIGALGELGIEAARAPGRTGVWVGGAKVASIGVAVRRWVSYHGFALNVSPDLHFFDLIHPCGLRGIHMTSLAELLGGDAPSLDRTGELVADSLSRTLGYPAWRWDVADEAYRLAGLDVSNLIQPAGATR